MDYATTTNDQDALDAKDIVCIVLSLVAPGAGHIILGQTIKGVVILLAVLATLGVGLIVSSLAAVDCYLLAKARKERTVGEWEFFPERRRSAA